MDAVVSSRLSTFRSANIARDHVWLFSSWLEARKRASHSGGFLKLGYPQIIQFGSVFSIFNHPAIGGTPIYRNIRNPHLGMGSNLWHHKFLFWCECLWGFQGVWPIDRIKPYYFFAARGRHHGQSNSQDRRGTRFIIFTTCVYIYI